MTYKVHADKPFEQDQHPTRSATKFEIHKGTGSPPENSIEVEPCVKENNPIIIPIPRFSKKKYSLRKQLITCDSRQSMYEK